MGSLKDIVVLGLIVFATFAVDLLYDDNTTMGTFAIYEDSLRSMNVNIHYVSEEGWVSLVNMDMLWIPDIRFGYSIELIRSIQNFSRSGNPVIIWHSECLASVNVALNDLLTDQGWLTTLHVEDLGIYGREYVKCINDIHPITDYVDSIKLILPSRVDCGSNAFPICYEDSSCTVPVMAISYPYLHEDNCSSTIYLLTGALGFIETYCDGSYYADNVRFALNVLYAAAGLEGYEFDACAFAESVFVSETYYPCSRTPNPFTPNGDGINDEAEFTFPGLGEVEGVIKIFTLENLKVRTIEVPAGWGAKQSAVWDGTDNGGAPLRQGIYLYTIKSEGRIKCKGTVTLAR